MCCVFVFCECEGGFDSDRQEKISSLCNEKMVTVLKKAYNPKKFDFPKRTESTDLFPRALPVHIVPKLERETKSETAMENEADREIERQNEREIARLRGFVCGYVVLCCG